MPEAPTELIGRMIGGKIVLEHFVGEGAMGWVFRARHEGLKKGVAIKVLRWTSGFNRVLSARFAQEAQAASRLEHPNSVAILDFGEDGEDRLLYIAMEFLDGEDLLMLLSREWPLDDNRVCDVKPANIMVLQRKDDDGEVTDLIKVCDFGLAKMMPLDNSNKGVETVPGAVLGTPIYMSPEQATGEQVGPETDVYSSGVVLYQMLTGRSPFKGETAMQILMKHVSEKPVPIGTLCGGVSPKLASAVHWALEKDPANRPTARELRKVLREITEGASPLIPRSSSGTGTNKVGAAIPGLL